ncbi:hypothetical protein D9758_006873 [Tetrapyrgos nigripes]|uniref:HAT C-terminal dimerisation domain-containing protein n=1 Tax=Tetrapyrgos nigripes TaxID=182062 RepID=A0A8H5GSE6_9AGAR|nr:hypothetical protein D9758_006873 [Tetrapyrgos nigripes]
MFPDQQQVLKADQSGSPPTTPLRIRSNPDRQSPPEPPIFQSAVPFQPSSTPSTPFYQPYTSHYHTALPYGPHPQYQQWPFPYYSPNPTPQPSRASTPLTNSTPVQANFITWQPPLASGSQSQASSMSRKRSAPTSNPPPSRNVRARQSSDKENHVVPRPAIAPTPTATISGAGPIPNPSFPAPSPLPPALDSSIFKSVQAKQKRSDSGSHGAATDCWYFMVPADTDAIPPPNPNLKPFATRPKGCKWLACRLCPEGNKVGTFQNASGGLTRSIRRHLTKFHGPIYNEFVPKFKLKGWDSLESTPTISKYFRHPGEEFSTTVFMELLVRWIVVDDQPINVIECPEFRDVLAYIGLDLAPNDIPHRTKLMELIFSQFDNEFTNIKREIQNSLGRISYTSDMWSRGNLEGYMAVTAHYFIRKDGHLVMKSRLIAFRHIGETHDGETMAKYFFTVLNELGITRRIGSITLDNASNNNTMMRALERMFREIGIQFSAEGNRIRCFPHIINIAVKTGLSKLTYAEEPQGFQDPDGVTEADIVDFTPPPAFESISPDYLAALKVDLIARVRKLVNACRASGKRRSGLRKVVIEIREAVLAEKEQAGVEITEDDENNVIKVVVLLRDVDTRWSSIFLMIDRMFLLYPAIQKFAQLPENDEIHSLLLKDSELLVLNDIRLYLKAFHVIQEAVSGERTPTLSFVLPLYERLVSNLKKLRIILPNLSHMIDSSLDKIYEYVDKARSTHIYAFALVINPASKLTWIEDQWSEQDASNAKAAIINVMTEHRTLMCHEKAQSEVPGRIPIDFGGSDAARALNSGFDYLDEFTESLNTLSRTSSTSLSLTSSLASVFDDTSESHDTVLSDEERENEAMLEDHQLAKEELASWIGEGVLQGRIDLIHFWDSSTLQRKFLSLFRLALDVLPAQASAVPCERVFSSSKETDTDRRTRMSSVLVEVLQILKALYRDDRLNFTKSWVAKPSELGEENDQKYCTESDSFKDGMTITDLQTDELRDMLVKGQVADIMRLVEASYNSH